MPADVAAVRERVQTYLTSEFSVQLDSDGDYSVAVGSARAFVRVKEHPNGQAVLISVFALVLDDVNPTPGLWQYVALNADAYVFGHLSAVQRDDGKVLLVFSHRLLGDFLDKDELLYAVYAIAGSADQMDDELQQRFGGQRWADR